MVIEKLSRRIQTCQTLLEFWKKNGRKKKFVGVVTLSITTLVIMTLSIINDNLMTFNITLC
jgi:hypothetical protein